MKPTYRLETVSIIAICAAAGTLDALEILLTLTIAGSILSFFLGAIAGFALWLTFKLHGVSYTGKGALKKAGTLAGTTVLEMIPFISALPFTLIGAVIIILESRKEDRERAKQKEAEGQAKATALARTQAQMQQQIANNAAQQHAMEEEQLAA